MAHFQTEIIVPNQQPRVSAFFRVYAPSFLLIFTVAFFQVYYKMNGYPIPTFLNLLLIVPALIFPFVWWYTWYHGVVQEKGELHVSADAIDIHWNNPKVEQHFPLEDLKNLAIIYDGYAGGFFNPYQGTNNQLKFAHNGENYAFNFRLKSEADAGEMAKVVKQWYEKGYQFADLNTEGQERYLMIYGPQYREALAHS